MGQEKITPNFVLQRASSQVKLFRIRHFSEACENPIQIARTQPIFITAASDLELEFQFGTVSRLEKRKLKSA